MEFTKINVAHRRRRSSTTQSAPDLPPTQGRKDLTRAGVDSPICASRAPRTTSPTTSTTAVTTPTNAGAADPTAATEYWQAPTRKSSVCPASTLLPGNEANSWRKLFQREPQSWSGRWKTSHFPACATYLPYWSRRPARGNSLFDAPHSRRAPAEATHDLIPACRFPTFNRSWCRSFASMRTGRIMPIRRRRMR